MHSYAEKVLDFEKIKVRLKEYALSETGREALLALQFLPYLALNQELDFLEELIKETSFRPFSFNHIPDIRVLLRQSDKDSAVLEPLEFLQIYSHLETSKELKDYALASESLLVKSFAQTIPDTDNLMKRISGVMDREGNIKDSASAKLLAIRQKMTALKSSIEQKLQGILNNPHLQQFIQESIYTRKDERWVIPVKRDFKSRIKGLVIAASASGETLFIEPKDVIDDNNNYTELVGEEKQEIYKILRSLTATVRNNLPLIGNLIEKITYMDAHFSKARLAGALDAHRPRINQEGRWRIKEARHPLIQRPVPIDIELGENFRLLIITGPNTGGKTVALKTMGLLSMMANCGLFIPTAPDSEVSLVDHILIDIGDEQSITQSLSTFSAHMEHMKEILKRATPSSLVLIDEIGAGTDPRDGSALAIALTEALLTLGARAIITTHLENMKNLAFQHEAIMNGSVEFNLENLTPLYKLRIGVTGKSYALEIAEKLGLGKNIIQRAAKIIEQKGYRDTDLERIIEDLNDKTTQAQKEKSKYVALSLNLEKKAERIEQKDKELKSLERKLKNQEGGALLDEIKSVRKKLIGLIEAAKNYNDLENLKRKARELENLAADTRELLVEKTEATPSQKVQISEITIEQLEIGDRVLLKKFDKEAKIIGLDKGKQIFTVLLGAIKIKVHFDEILPIDKKIEVQNINVQVNIDTGKSLPLELNIIGKRREDAYRDVEQYLYNLCLRNAQEGAVVHGRGSGVLKQMVEEILKESPQVDGIKVSPDGGKTVFSLV